MKTNIDPAKGFLLTIEALTKDQARFLLSARPCATTRTLPATNYYKLQACWGTKVTYIENIDGEYQAVTFSIQSEKKEPRIYVIIGLRYGLPNVLAIKSTQEKVDQFLAETFPEFYRHSEYKGKQYLKPGANADPHETYTMLLVDEQTLDHE